ncbi:MAG: hypothetical protein P1S46_01935 [bacterium]|nr:hypothetical protein [bacterium]
MNPGTLSIPALVATVLFLSSMAFMPVRLQAAARAGNDARALSSSGSDSTACDLAPYSGLLNEGDMKTGSGLRELPPLDSEVPSKVATATFAMG